METATLQNIKIIHPKEGSDRGQVVGSDGTKLTIWRDKIHLVKEGQSYEIGYSEKQVGSNVYRNVQSVKLIDTPLTQRTAMIPISESGNDDPYRKRPTPTVDAERMFVAGALNAAIQAGRIEPLNKNNITAFVDVMRGVWTNTFGADGASGTEPITQRRVQG
jgi:hypothetical protein